MGFLFTRKPPHGKGIRQHGIGDTNPPPTLVVNPIAAGSVSNANDPNISVGSVSVTASVAVSTSVAKSPIVTNAAWATPGISPDAFFWDDFTYAGADDAAKTVNLQKVIAPAAGGTGGGTILYDGGSNGQYAAISSNPYLTVPSPNSGSRTPYTYEGHAILEYHQPPSTGITPQLWPSLPTLKDAVWFRVKYIIPIGWTSYGNGAGGRGYKRFGLQWELGINQRVSIESDASTSGAAGEVFIVDINSPYTGQAKSASTADIGYGTLPDPSNTSAVRDLVYIGYPINSTLWKQMIWESLDGSVPVLKSVMYMMMAHGTLPKIRQFQLGLNKNNNTLSNQDFYLYFCNWQFVDPNTNPDPWGLIALGGGNVDTMTITGSPTVTNVTPSGPHGGTITLTVTGTSFTAHSATYIRSQISNLDVCGTNLLSVHVTVINSTTLTCTLNAASLAAGTYYFNLAFIGGGWTPIQTRPLAFTLA